MNKNIKAIIAILIIAIFISAFLNIFLYQKIDDKEKEIIREKSENSSLESNIRELQQSVDDLEKKNKSLSDYLSELNSYYKKLNDNNERDLQELNSNNNQIYQQSNNNVRFESSRSNSEGNATVVYRKSGCDYFILENNRGFIVAEWMGGNDPDIGDNISGNFHSFGTKDYYNQSRSSDSRLWLDDYDLSTKEHNAVIF